MRRFAGGQWIAVLLLSAAPASAETLGEALARLQAVGREGAGSEAAAHAWKELVRRGPEALPAILQAMDDSDSANWLRTAGDAIAERAAAAGKPLPAEALEQFVRQTKHNGAARRLAYEWLCRIDAKTPDRLLPSMLQDPSSELRRDAVDAVLKEAHSRSEKGDKDASRAALQRALKGACDKDQVDLIVKKLDKLGVKVNVAAHFGFVRQWLLVAPFDNRAGVGFNVAYPPEKSVDPKTVHKGKDGKEARWSAVSTHDPYGVVDLNKELGKQQGVAAYAFAVIESPTERPMQIRVGSLNAIKIFLNGKEIFHVEEYHHGIDMDQYVVNAALRAGRNELLLKVCQNEEKEEWAQVWGFQARLCDSVGTAIPFTQKPIKTDNPPKKAGESKP